MSDRDGQPDHFTRFGLSLIFEVDEAALLKCYYDLQRSHHPDRFIHATAEQQQWAVQQAAAINQAFHTLKDPLRRAEYLLTLQGVVCPAEQQRLADPDFLLEQMALREALAAATDQTTVAGIAAQIAALYSDHYQQLIRYLAVAAWEPAANRLSKLKFLAKLQQQVTQLATALAPS